MKVNSGEPEDSKFDEIVLNAKATMNGLSEARRQSLSPTKFIFYSNARVTKMDSKSDSVILTIDKPIDPPKELLGQPGYYSINDAKEKQ